MITLNLPEASESITVTLNELRTLETGYYLFVFTHIETRQTVTKIFNFLDDNSSYPDRYNEFTVATATLFSGRPKGFWRYEVYEQESGSNTNPEGLNQVEKGMMKLIGSVFAFTEFESTTTYKAYAG